MLKWFNSWFDINRRIQIDKPVCVYTIYAKSEKQAYKKLVKYLTSVGKLSSLDDMERWCGKGEV